MCVLHFSCCYGCSCHLFNSIYITFSCSPSLSYSLSLLCCCCCCSCLQYVYTHIRIQVYLIKLLFANSFVRRLVRFHFLSGFAFLRDFSLLAFCSFSLFGYCSASTFFFSVHKYTVHTCLALFGLNMMCPSTCQLACHHWMRSQSDYSFYTNAHTSVQLRWPKNPQIWNAKSIFLLENASKSFIHIEEMENFKTLVLLG